MEDRQTPRHRGEQSGRAIPFPFPPPPPPPLFSLPLAVLNPLVCTTLPPSPVSLLGLPPTSPPLFLFVTCPHPNPPSHAYLPSHLLPPLPPILFPPPPLAPSSSHLVLPPALPHPHLFLPITYFALSPFLPPFFSRPSCPLPPFSPAPFFLSSLFAVYHHSPPRPSFAPIRAFPPSVILRPSPDSHSPASVLGFLISPRFLPPLFRGHFALLLSPPLSLYTFSLIPPFMSTSFTPPFFLTPLIISPPCSLSPLSPLYTFPPSPPPLILHCPPQTFHSSFLFLPFPSRPPSPS